MKLPLRILLPLMFSLLPSIGLAGGGGPDAYGYTWKDSNEPGGPAFSWLDIRSKSGAVEVTGLGDDNSVGMFSIGWNFHYYWSDYDRVKIGSNGWISFDNVGNIASCFPTLPTAGGAGDNLLAAMMGDLTFSSNSSQSPNPGRVHYWSNQVDSFVVQYTDVPWWRNNTPDWIGSNTFQIILRGQDSSITFQYLSTDAVNLPLAPGCAQSFACGMENLTGGIGLGVSSGTQSAVPGSQYAIRFEYPATVSMMVPDAAPIWVSNTENAGQFVLVGQPFTLQTRVGNVGNNGLVGPLTLTGQVKAHPAQTQVFAQTRTISGGLQPGQDTLATFPTTLVLSQAGQYAFSVTTSHSQDINATNNTSEVELAAVKMTGSTALLTYCTGGLPDGGVSWQGADGDEGVAVEIVPPAYPMTIDSLSFFVLGDDANPATPMPFGFQIKIFGSDLNGGVDLNNLLLSQNVLAQDVIEDNWNRIALSSSVSVTTGSVFLAWMQGGEGVSLATEGVGPISRRSYEILGGAWSPYRSNDQNEFFIQASVSLPVSTLQATSNALSMSAYPNPASGLLNLRFELAKAASCKLQLVDVIGRSVWAGKAQFLSPGEHFQDIQLAGIPAGIYLLQLHAGDESKAIKVVVE